ncbi:MAG: phosphoserine transaminase [Nocardioides sp.]
MTIQIPQGMLPADGRFGSGPSKVAPAHLAALAATGADLMGTSHRQAPVRNLVGSVRAGLTDLFSLPEGHEVVLGNGGSAAFWDLATYALIERRSQHAVFGAFGAKFATAAASAPWLEAPVLRRAEAGSQVLPEADAEVDTYAWAHNETSTGVMAPTTRPDGSGEGELTLVDATSAAGGLAVDAGEVDVYYFAPQKAFASDGGLWLSLMSPAAIERAERIASSGRHIPAFFDLVGAIKNSRANQTYNTPAIATLFLMQQQLDWMATRGGLDAMVQRSATSAATLYAWAEKSSYLTPFVADPDHRSDVVVTLELDPAIDKSQLRSVLTANGIVDLDSYRGVGTNQLRVAVYPAVDPADVEALTACVDYVVERL